MGGQRLLREFFDEWASRRAIMTGFVHEEMPSETPSMNDLSEISGIPLRTDRFIPAAPVSGTKVFF